MLALVLEQVLDVAPRFREDHGLLMVTPEGALLVRAARSTGDSWVWEDRRIKPATFSPPPIRVVMDAAAADAERGE
ncbi:MAG: hypothetical protein NZ528_03215 [Caldilineales bacterium]|nr:hypothetical protein [Caldilineales bacterium]MDW8318417.1 hypothetical protein [Anaerolineae bacterium]